MKTAPSDTSILATVSPPPGEEEEPTARARRLYLTKRRHELLAPAHALLELVEMLFIEEKIAACERVCGDLRRIDEQMRRAMTLIATALHIERTEHEASKALNHDLRNLMTTVLGFSSDLERRAPKFYLEEFKSDFRELHRLGRRLLSLGESTVDQLRAAGGYAAVDDVSRYLDRLAAPLGEADNDLAPSPVPGRILVADDSEPIRALLCEHLRSQGHTALPAKDGAEALAIVEAGNVDLVMTDIEMPETNGFELIEKLRNHPRHRDIPVIVISGLGELDGIAHCLKMGAEDCLPKPFNQVILKARVDACLEKKRLRDRTEQQRLRYNELLNAILPGPVVDELVLTDTVQPRRRDGVAVLFADIVGFTNFCDLHQSSPEQVVQHLRRLFEAWEDEASTLRVQKIKTIGDAFMAAGGLLTDAENPVLDCVQLGLSMIQFTRQLCDDDGKPLGFNLRVGIHAGTVVSGVLGRRQSLFDLWGDTVNVAARLESHGKPGCVNLSLESWQRVSDRFSGETRSSKNLKGKPGMTEIIHLDPDTVVYRDLPAR